MPVFIEERPQPNGRIGYIYDIGSEDPSLIAEEILATADAPFVFQGQVGSKKAPIEDPKYVRTTLERNGRVAAVVPYSGTSVTVAFAPPSTMLVTPADGDRFTADALIGAAAADGFDPYGYDDISDAEDFDPFDSGGMPEPSGMPDPRSGSAAPMGRYGTGPDGYDDDGYYDGYGDRGYGSGGAPAMKVSDWLLTLLVLLIPIVNIIALIIWLVSKKTNPSKKSFLIVYLAFGIIAAILTGVVAYGAISSGLVSAIANGDVAILQPVRSEADTPAYDEDDEDEDATANENANSNSNANANGNSGIFANTTNENLSGEPQQGRPVVTLENLTRTLDAEGRSVAIITMTLSNPYDIPMAPSAMLDVSGIQGQNMLSPSFSPQDGFIPATFDAAIDPGETGVFQVCYILQDDQDVTIRVLDKQTQQTLLDVKEPVR